MLPKNIDYSEFASTSGLGTKQWGPAGWHFMFSCIMGAYPFRLDRLNREHRAIKRHFKQMFDSLAYTMPCIFCRQSITEFMKELPVHNFMQGRMELMYWLYRIKDKVNEKLLAQEQQCYNTEKKRLKQEYYEGKLSEDQYYSAVDAFRKKTFSTQPTPPFIDVVRKYESLRAVCSKRAKTCSLPITREVESQ